MQGVRPRPLGVTILGILMILAGLFDLAPAAVINYNADQFAAVLILFSLFLGIVFIVTGVGFLQGLKSAWTPGLILAVLNLVRTLFAAAQSGIAVAILGIVVALIIIYYILTPSVQNYFGRGPQPRN